VRWGGWKRDEKDEKKKKDVVTVKYDGSYMQITRKMKTDG